MNFLWDPVGFVADCISIANAFGFETPFQKAEKERLFRQIEQAERDILELQEHVDYQTERIKTMVTHAVVIEVRSRLKAKNISAERLETLIRLLFLIKTCEMNVVFAIVIKYRKNTTAATLGLAGTSFEVLEELVEKFDTFYRISKLLKEPKTVYLNVRIRGKYSTDVENICTAALLSIVSVVLRITSPTELVGEELCGMEPQGEKTVVMLRSIGTLSGRPEFDRLRRVFIVGETRSGKSTLGNALLCDSVFQISKGMTGTLQIERGERIDVRGVEEEIWITEIYDTPGLSDRDGLDIWYQTAIEDHIRVLQRASSLVMTVNIDGGITQATFRCLEDYKDLFGESMANMLIIVLTTNEPAEELELQKELNWPTISRLDYRIQEENVFCLSLHDLRNKNNSDSHKIVQNIALNFHLKPMKIIEALAQRYRDLQQALKQKSGDLEEAVKELMDEGWQTFDKIESMYLESPFKKLVDDGNGFFNGFLMKNSSPTKKILAAITGGMVNRIKKTAVHFEFHGSRAANVWNAFLKKHSAHRNDSDLMYWLGEDIYNARLAVAVQELDMTIGPFRIHRFLVRVFDPAVHFHEELSNYLHEFLNQEAEEIRPDVAGNLMTSMLPSALPSTRSKKKNRKKKSSISPQASHS